MRRRFTWAGLLAGGLLLGYLATRVLALGYTDTPLQPNGTWRVHDGTRPQPPVVTPGDPAAPAAPPSDAVVLFDGKNLDAWCMNNDPQQPAKWKLADGVMTVAGGDLWSKQKFGDLQLHVEWSEPEGIGGSDQGRGNSGVFLCNAYEIQVLDSFQNLTYADGMAGAIYGQYPPLANPCRPPGQWNVYDIVWEEPKFKEPIDGKECVPEKPAYATVLFNGVVVHNHTAEMGPMRFHSRQYYTSHAPQGSIHLQDHGNPVRYRNIWVRELKGYDQR